MLALALEYGMFLQYNRDLAYIKYITRKFDQSDKTLLWHFLCKGDYGRLKTILCVSRRNLLLFFFNVLLLTSHGVLIKFFFSFFLHYVLIYNTYECSTHRCVAEKVMILPIYFFYEGTNIIFYVLQSK